MDNSPPPPIWDDEPAPAKPKRKRPWLRWLAELGIFLLIISAIFAWKKQGMREGEAPDFTRQTLSGEQLRLDDLRGKPVLLYFWASWCPVCELQQGNISAIHQDWPVVTVAFQSGGITEVERYMEREGIMAWRTIVDEDGTLGQLYGVQGVPALFVVDEEGTIRFREVGWTSEWGLRLRLWLADWLV